jgi:hypothetical protein
MNMPGFYAEASLGMTRTKYSAKGALNDGQGTVRLSACDTACRDDCESNCPNEADCFDAFNPPLCRRWAAACPGRCDQQCGCGPFRGSARRAGGRYRYRLMSSAVL